MQHGQQKVPEVPTILIVATPVLLVASSTRYSLQFFCAVSVASALYGKEKEKIPPSMNAARTMKVVQKVWNLKEYFRLLRRHQARAM